MLDHAGTRQLETSRLLLRQYEMSDAHDLYTNRVTDPEVCRFWSREPHTGIDETKALLARWIEDYARAENYHWVLVLKSISQAVGYSYLADIDDANNSVSVHYALSRMYWNQGLMTEACTCVLEFAFKVLGADKVHTSHHIDTPASGQALSKSGMRPIKTAYKQFFEHEHLGGDRLYYEITAPDGKRT